ncbi:hypothetical protein O181_021458 [Austropuccinia psidii MF-1]|uniref:Secreted protein n=1 Tax=Austropuccinia psidii MF-1 TaxID=1389203 RepID=A0A9Q3CDE3_9BASI|nr:hypothetical protein [Austropuccinia psidii MF-1]
MCPSASGTTSLPSPILMLLHCTLLTLLQCPMDMPLTLPPQVHPHLSLCFCAPATYHAYTLATSYRYASNPAAPSRPSPLPNALCHLPCYPLLGYTSTR